MASTVLPLQTQFKIIKFEKTDALLICKVSKEPYENNMLQIK